jgi:acyl transferase domain-containing protein
LVALDIGISAFRHGLCNKAVVGVVNVILSSLVSVNLAQVGFLCPEGQCKAFDSSADGYVRSEGCAAIIIKHLSDALRDRDRVYACIKSSYVNQDGKSNGFEI